MGGAGFIKPQTRQGFNPKGPSAKLLTCVAAFGREPYFLG